MEQYRLNMSNYKMTISFSTWAKSDKKWNGAVFDEFKLGKLVPEEWVVKSFHVKGNRSFLGELKQLIHFYHSHDHVMILELEMNEFVNYIVGKRTYELEYKWLITRKGRSSKFVKFTIKKIF